MASGNAVNGQGQVKEEDLKELKNRMKLIVDTDPAQFHDDYSLKRYLRAFKTVDGAFQVQHCIVNRSTDCLSQFHSKVSHYYVLCSDTVNVTNIDFHFHFTYAYIMNTNL